jgi:superoxide dismutase
VDVDKAKKRLPKLLEPLYQQALGSGYHWLAMETAELLSRLKAHSTYNTQAAVLREDSSIHGCVAKIFY